MSIDLSIFTSLSARLMTCAAFVLCFTALTVDAGERRYTEKRQPCAHANPLRQPFFGDLHVHTRYSLDASTQSTRTTPAQAYEFAKGKRIGIQPWSEDGKAMRSLQLREPLDFAMVSDHAELIGEVNMCSSPDIKGYGSMQCRVYRAWPRAAYYLFNYYATMRKGHLGMCGDDGEHCLDAALAPWQEMQDAAELHYDRSADCEFTTFVGYEWTGMDADTGGNLHRNVVFRQAQATRLPISFIDAPAPSLLWQQLEQQCIDAEGHCDALVIPHNSNLSAGLMFSGLSDSGKPMSAQYARQRARHEPLVEIMQHKGASECFYAPGVTEDELCAFEQLPVDNIAGMSGEPQPDTGFVRQVLADGLALERRLGVNPYQFGFIASTDTHLGAPGAAQEDTFLGHGGAGTPASKKVPVGLPDKLSYNPGGLVALWAEENSRDALFDAMRRREAYATSGPRIVSRFFGGWDLPDQLCKAPDRIEQAYAKAVPMGSVLPQSNDKHSKPAFLVAASRSASAGSNPLQRLQVIKISLTADGKQREQVIEVAGKADNGASVDTRTCKTHGPGAAQLCAVWRDEHFNPDDDAVYYARVVENPSCRWSQRMCVAAGVDCSKPDTIGDGYEGCCAAEHRPVIQERAWTSPIWYQTSKR